MIHVYDNFDLKERNTFGMPVKCRKFIEYDSEDDLPDIARMLPEGEPWIHIGAGSNLLFTGDYPGTVLHSALDGACVVEMSADDVVVRASSAEKLDDIAAWTCDQQWWGLENLSGIPGEVGAAAVQNVGAYGIEACDVIDAIHVYDLQNKTFETLSPKDCDYGYRQSMFKTNPGHHRYIIIAVDFRLSSQPRPRLAYPALQKALIGYQPQELTPEIIRHAVTRIRQGKLPDPKEVPNAGSFFRNPVIEADAFAKIKADNPQLDVLHYILADGRIKIPAAWLIEQCGWKGRQVGNAGVWHLQPLVIVNAEGKASPDEILALEKAIVESVNERFGIELKPEVEHV